MTRSSLRRARRSRVAAQGRGAELLDVDIEFATELGIDFQSIKKHTEDYVISRIRANAKAGKKPSGAKFRRYSKKYQRELQRAGEGTQVDLTRTGYLLAAFRLLKARLRRISKTTYTGRGLGVARRQRNREAQLVMEFGFPNEYLRQAIGLAAIGYKFVGLGKRDLAILKGAWERAGIIIKKRGGRRRKLKIGPVRPNGRF